MLRKNLQAPHTTGWTPIDPGARAWLKFDRLLYTPPESVRGPNLVVLFLIPFLYCPDLVKAVS